jgi:uncharacterized protein (TIGR04255 family)
LAHIWHLRHPPITEALFDFRVRLERTFDPAAFKGLRDEMTPQYPTMDEQQTFEAAITMGPGTSPAAQTGKPTINGYIFKSADGLTIAQFRRDGFTLNRLRPYTSWADLLPEVLRLWHRYEEIARPIALARLAVRYINQLELDFPVALNSVLVAPPPLPEGITDPVESFLTRVVVHSSELGVAAIVTQATQPAVKPNMGIIILDIDAFHAPASGAVQSAEVEPVLGALHQMKNRLFFGSLTESFVRRYE